MDWKVLVPLVLTSSVLAAFLTQALTVLKDAWNRRRDGNFAALYVALALEEYASACASVVGDIQTYTNSRGHAGEQWQNVPPLADFADHIDWKALGVKFTSEALAFRVRVNATREMLIDLSQHVTEPLDDEARERAVALGVEAIRIAERLRRARNLGPAYAPSKDWSIQKYLEERQAEIEAERAQRAAKADDLALA